MIIVLGEVSRLYRREPGEQNKNGEQNKRTPWVIKRVVVLICCVLSCKQPFAPVSLMEASVGIQGEAL